MEHRFLLCVDVRFPGGTSTSVISEIEALADRFEPDQVGILVIESALFARGAPTNQALALALESSPFPVYRFDDLKGTFVDWCLEVEGRRARGGRPCRFLHAGYLVVHNPYAAAAVANLAGRLSADFAIVACHQPYLDAGGNAYYSAAEIVTAVGALAPEVRFAPIGLTVRRAFEQHGWTQSHVAAFNWPNTFDFEQSVSPDAVTDGLLSESSDMLVIGRHSRPEWPKWPGTKEEFSRIYQDGTQRLVRFLGWGPYCEQLFDGDIPPNWEVMPFNAMQPSEFLRSIDAFVYYHHSNWVEGFGRTALEAIAAGVPCILPPHFAETFGGAALYATPAQVTPFLEKLDERKPELGEWATFARELAEEAFGPQRILDVYDCLANTSPAQPKSFAVAELSLKELQRLSRLRLESGFKLQAELGLTPDDSDEALATVPADAVRLAAPNDAASADYAIYMDFRSARSDLWRSIELAEALAQTGNEVALVHVELRTNADLAYCSPLLGELSPEIAVYGVGPGPRPRYLNLRKGVIIAAPQRLFDDAGRPLFEEIVRPIAPAVVALVDRNLTATWFERADDLLTLMCGLRPKWALVGLKLDEVGGAPPGMVEAPELFAFVASRNSVDGRELMRYAAPRSQVRVGRIGLMDQTQWKMSEAGPAEDFGALPLFCYASLSARLIPRQLLDNQDFHVFRAAEIGLERFLKKIDLVTYFPSARPSDSMLIPLLRAIQAGVLAVVDGGLKDLLGSLALYASAEDARPTVERLASDPRSVTRLALSKARELALESRRDRALQAIEALFEETVATVSSPEPAASARLNPQTSSRPEVLFLSSNGVGLGHLTRLMAIARRLQYSDPVFLTMSQAFRVVEAAGWPVKYLPFHQLSGCNIEHWNEWLQYEVEQILTKRPRIRTLVFDGSNPYSGLLGAFASTSLRKIWIQRGMWKKGHMSPEHVRRGKNFDLIIEPSDIADSAASELLESAAFDKVVTDPIWLLEKEELLSRKKARANLNLPTDKPCCLIQLGSGTNRDVVSLLAAIIPTLKRYGIVPCIAEWLMGSEIPRIWPGVVDLRLFPIARYLRAFDFSISAAGYNSFHELVGFEVPTIFIANNHHMMDDQSARAEFAMRNDAAIWVEEEAVANIGSAIDMILRADVKEMIAEGCRALTPRNGAAEAALLVDSLATGMKLGRSTAIGGQFDPNNVVPLFAEHEAA